MYQNNKMIDPHEVANKLTAIIGGCIGSTGAFLLNIEWSWHDWLFETGMKIIATGLVAAMGGFCGLAGKWAWDQVVQKFKEKPSKRKKI